MKRKQDWRTKSKGGKAVRSVDGSPIRYPVEPHGHRSDLPKGGVVVVTPPIARRLKMAKADVKDLPTTEYHDKKDNARVKYFMDLIARGIVPPPAQIHYRPDGTIEILDGRHRIEAYRRLGYMHIPVVENATLYDTLHGLDKSEGKMENMPIIGTAIEPVVPEPLFIKSRRVQLSPEAAADLGIHDETTLGHSQRLRAKAAEMSAKQGLKKLAE